MKVLTLKKDIDESTFLLSLFVIFFQLSVTILISTLCIYGYVSGYGMPPITKQVLYIDCIFIILHLLYRRTLRRKKAVSIPLPLSQILILILHSITSLMSILCTWLVLNGYPSSNPAIPLVYILGIIILWYLSCITGIIFFMRKYFE